MKNFGDFDTLELIPFLNRPAKQYLNTNISDCNPDYNLALNYVSTDTNTGLKSYFVFKGGNVIKYWTLDKYIKKKIWQRS